MSTKRQFKMNLDDSVIERLKKAAARLGRDTGQEVAEEILTVYFPVWLAVSDSTRRAVDYQTRITTEKNERLANEKFQRSDKVDFTDSEELDIVPVRHGNLPTNEKTQAKPKRVKR